jgi:signal transduction histidine kinase
MLTGNPATVTETCCAANGAPYCEFDISWRPKPFFARVGSLFKTWIASDLIEELEENEKKNLELIRNQDRVIELRTQQLKEAQAQLIEAEKRTLEHRITGGFAHEMRNALAGAQLEFKTTLNYKDQGKPSAEILKDSATNLLKNISVIHEKYNIPRGEIATLLLPELKTIAEIADHLAGVHADVSHDLDRGLSITTQIRDYARMSELRPGNDSVDMVSLLKSYGDRYRQDFERIGITYTVEAPESAIVKADETHINSIFSNLVLNAKDALEEIEADQPKEIKITLEKRDDETGSLFTINVTDNGPGIPDEHLQEIFEPFYSTKPSTGTGLGLGVVRRLVQLYGGTIEVRSEMDKRTVFSVVLPDEK